MNRCRTFSRPVLVALTALALVIGALALVAVSPGGPPPASAATRVAKDDCRRIDPGLVNGVCLRYSDPRGSGVASGLTWIGTYQAPDGRVFFCIDFLYDSRLPAQAGTVSTEGLINQLGDGVGEAEVAALNHVISTWAGRGSTGSDARDAAIALIVREVMGDGTRPDGVVVYPGGLRVGDRVRPPVGGLDGDVVELARDMWRQASRSYGPWRLSLQPTTGGPMRLGRTRTYRVTVTSASGRAVAGVPVQLRCQGPITCPHTVTTGRRAARWRVQPSETGRYRVRAQVSGPAADGLLYREQDWHTHGGATARPSGVQRGWIAQENRARATVRERTTIEKALPQVSTQTSQAEVEPGAEIHDVVTVDGLPDDYDAMVVATLHGPYDEPPGPDACTDATRAARVRFEVDGNGTVTTPPVVVDAVGYYTWVERFHGDRWTEPLTTGCGIVEETTLVEPFTPVLDTRTSRRRAEVGDVVQDTVEVRGLRDTAATLAWTLHGPRAAVGDSCEDVSWEGAPIAARGSLAIPGDGTYRTPAVRLERHGCYTYAQRVAPTALSTEGLSVPGLAAETTLVRRRTPAVTTMVSEQRALVGDRLRDTVLLHGLRDGDRVRVTWRLHGPLAPRGATSCRDLDWDAAPVADRGEFGAVGNGRHRTRWSSVGAPGCYTYSERVRATEATEAAATPPGVASETALVTRPALPVVPEIPSGFDILASDLLGERIADRPTARARPRYLDRRYVAAEAADGWGRSVADHAELRIPAIGVHAAVSAVGLDRTTMAIPDETSRLGWLSGTAAADDLLGSSVISGHVSDRYDRPGALARLAEVRPGEVVLWTTADGAARRFVVRRLQRFPRSVGVPARLFRTTGPHVLHLITCTTRRRTSTGFHYVDNLVVTAEAIP